MQISKLLHCAPAITAVSIGIAARQEEAAVIVDRNVNASKFATHFYGCGLHPLAERMAS
jgi:hypothetical protein